VIFVEKLPGEAGATIELADVLMFGDGERTSAGAEELSGVSVTATVLEQKRDTRSSSKKKRRHNYRRRKRPSAVPDVLRIRTSRPARSRRLRGVRSDGT